MATPPHVLDDCFEPAGEGTVDNRNRVTLGKAIDHLSELFGSDASRIRFVVSFNKAGQILLSPQTAVPLHEAWLYKNPKALASLRRGIEQAERGQTTPMGDFSPYADDDIE